MSHPTRVRGLKSVRSIQLFNQGDVAPYTGAWIEIDTQLNRLYNQSVAPYTGAWIEIQEKAYRRTVSTVAPYTGAWIEIHKDSV